MRRLFQRFTWEDFMLITFVGGAFLTIKLDINTAKNDISYIKDGMVRMEKRFDDKEKSIAYDSHTPSLLER